MSEFPIDEPSNGEPEPAPPDRIEQLAIGLEAIMNAIEAMNQRLKELEKEPGKAKIAPWNWRELDLDGRQTLAGELVDFITWFNVRYGRNDASIYIAECWPRHPIVVEELTALMVSWQVAYHDATKPNDAPINFHDRWLWPAMRRIHSEPWGTGKCVGRHETRSPITRASSTEGYVDLEGWVADGGTLPPIESAPR